MRPKIAGIALRSMTPEEYRTNAEFDRSPGLAGPT